MSPFHFKRLSDESLGSRLASGEAAAFDELYRRYSNRLAAYGSHLLGDAASGDDVAQATMLKAYAALREGRVPQKMKPWLFRIAHNAAIDLVVRRRELPSGDLPDAPAVDREPFAGALVEALATLPDRQRRVYVLREVHGLRIDETAAELGLTAPQVEQSLFAARNRLAEQLVFGDRLNCVTVQRLAAGPLDGPERRALKTHLRACTGCRQTLGVRGRALTLFPSASGLEWLRGLGAGLIGGGAPAAAKVGALFATATIAAGVPVAVEHTTHGHANRPGLHFAKETTAAPAVTSEATQVPVVAAVAVSSATTPVVRHAQPPSHDDVHAVTDRRGDGGGETESKGSSESSGAASSGSRNGGEGGGDSHSGDPAPTRATGSGESGDGGSSHGGSGSGGDLGEGGSHGGVAPATTTTTTTTSAAPTSESDSKDDSHSGDSSHSGDGSGSGGDHSGDGHSGDSATTTTSTTPALPPPLPTVTVPTGG